MKGIIVILGSSNDDKGNLLSIAKERLRQGIKKFKAHPNYKILLTGGYGKKFNKISKPHAYYAKQFLLKNGMKTNDILEFAESSFSAEDALLSKPIIDKYKVKKLIIITSDLHMKRIKYIFKEVFPGYDLSFSTSKTNLPKEEIDALIDHERDSMKMLKKRGLVY